MNELKAEANVLADGTLEVETDADVANVNRDVISRKAAIDAVEKESQVDGAYGYMDTKSIIDLLCDLPSAQPEIVRCKDCLHHTESGYCHNAECYGVFTKNEHYCGYAKRKGGKNE